ncbi:RING/U-box superfamily protein [Actinidia rufa]|uniref:RBR-type E3 ubiquitin transferase n=1 Tax=Actinidia rufa TaxID=165716 RepID=A0A7J0EIC6_9ERIC|nr:RING/U-box superfamily protein [Actinidia rufa]
MEDCASTDEEYYCGEDDCDRDSLGGFEEEESGNRKDSSSKLMRGKILGKAWDYNYATFFQLLQVITKDSLLAAQRDDLQRVMDLLSLKEHHAQTLLIHYLWDVDKVFSMFVEKGTDKLYKEAGVIVGELNDLSLFHFSTKVMCQVCMEDVPANEMITMDCGHCFCNNCWTEHFIVKINEGQSKCISCMAHKCNTIWQNGALVFPIVEMQYMLRTTNTVRLNVPAYTQNPVLVVTNWLRRMEDAT